MATDAIGLVADVGRASVRFGLSGGPAGVTPRDVRELDAADYSTFTGALTAYLDGVGARDRVLPSALAIAGAVRGDVINVTGSRWYVTLSGIRAVLRAPARAINDFAAAASALPMVKPTALRAIGAPPPVVPRPGGAYLAVGPGAGLGVAGLLSTGDALGAVPSEAGHIRFHPATEAEKRFAEAMTRRGVRYLDAESLLSAGGLIAAYEAAGGQPGLKDAEEVVRRARADPAARAAIELFAGCLGDFLGDLLLAFGAWDGAYLTGPLARALHGHLAGSPFRQRMEAKGELGRQLRTVPVAVVEQTQLELLGAAAVLQADMASDGPVR